MLFKMDAPFGSLTHQQARDWENEWEIEKSCSREEFASMIFEDSPLNSKRHNLIFMVPKQEIVIGEYLHLLPVILEYGPMMLAPDESCGGFILLHIKGNPKVFSLQAGGFAGIEALDAQKLYIAFSVNDGLAKISDAALDILGKTRSQWEGKLMLTPFAYRQTIREAQKEDKILATDDEMIAETVFRLRLLGFEDFDDWFVNQDCAPAFLQQFWKEVDNGESEPIVDELKTRYFDYGFRRGFKAAWNQFSEAGEAYLWLPDSRTFFILYKNNEFLLADHDFDEEWKACVKKTEEECGFKVYCVLGEIVNLDSFRDEHIMLSMLYVSRNMINWEDERRQTEVGAPKVYMKHLDLESRADFGIIGIKAVKEKNSRYAKAFRIF